MTVLLLATGPAFARVGLASCSETCVDPPGCVDTFRADGGAPAEALYDCAIESCPDDCR